MSASLRFSARAFVLFVASAAVADEPTRAELEEIASAGLVAMQPPVRYAMEVAGFRTEIASGLGDDGQPRMRMEQALPFRQITFSSGSGIVMVYPDADTAIDASGLGREFAAGMGPAKTGIAEQFGEIGPDSDLASTEYEGRSVVAIGLDMAAMAEAMEDKMPAAAGAMWKNFARQEFLIDAETRQPVASRILTPEGEAFAVTEWVDFETDPTFEPGYFDVPEVSNVIEVSTVEEMTAAVTGVVMTGMLKSGMRLPAEATPAE